MIGVGSNRGKFFWKNSPLMHYNNSVKKIIRKKIENSIKSLHTEYIDLYLVHWPYPDYFEEIWNEFEKIYKEGLVRSIGVCNCRERHLTKLEKSATILPMVNQFETSPLNTKIDLVKFCETRKIKVMVYSPLISLKRKEYFFLSKFINGIIKKI